MVMGLSRQRRKRLAMMCSFVVYDMSVLLPLHPIDQMDKDELIFLSRELFFVDLHRLLVSKHRCCVKQRSPSDHEI